MELGRVAEIEVVLEGIKLPATRDELIEYASHEDAAAAHELRDIPDVEYERLDAVGEALRRTEPAHRVEQPLPKPESDLPPGGSDYLKPFPESGHVCPSAPPDNPPQQVIEKASELQKRQKAVQEGESRSA